jgi:hypothetical protein
MQQDRPAGWLAAKLKTRKQKPARNFSIGGFSLAYAAGFDPIHDRVRALVFEPLNEVPYSTIFRAAMVQILRLAG